MINVKEAAQRAIEFVKDIYEGQNLQGLALEEIRLSDDEKWWEVTVGFVSLGGYREVRIQGNTLFPVARDVDIIRLPRDLKLVRINAETGEPAPLIVDRELSKAS